MEYWMYYCRNFHWFFSVFFRNKKLNFIFFDEKIIIFLEDTKSKIESYILWRNNEENGYNLLEKIENSFQNFKNEEFHNSGILKNQNDCNSMVKKKFIFF